MSTEFKKLEAGDTIRIIGEPVPYRLKTFEGKYATPIMCKTLVGGCPICKENAEYNERERLKAEGAGK